MKSIKEPERALNSDIRPGNTSGAPIVELAGVTKKYQHFQLQPVDLELKAGTVMR
ncbi:MAG: hypothetical protein Q8M16_02625 [Pirellulaceae bacterium]|nr:hypothetical protein [Pirellulaceae bacterium]